MPISKGTVAALISWMPACAVKNSMVSTSPITLAAIVPDCCRV